VLIRRWPSQPDISEMTTPARCAWCWRVYDLGRVTVLSRYSDCSIWRSPCCGRLVDDRRWGSRSDYTEIDKAAFTDSYTWEWI
jgi:hypothetical protein